MEFERYAIAAVSMALMVLLIVGTVGYASMRRTFGAAAAPPSYSRVENRARESDADIVVTPAAIGLGLLAILSLVFVANPRRKAAVASRN